MKKAFIISAMLLAASCTGLDSFNPYEGRLCEVTVSAEFPEGFRSLPGYGITIKVEDINTGSRYEGVTDASGTARFMLSRGLYRFNAGIAGDDGIFNGVKDKISISEGTGVDISLIKARDGKIIIREIYCGGCMKLPEEGTYQADKYMILHNNDKETQYLDGLCFGGLSPYNSNADNKLLETDPVTGEKKLPDFVPIIQAVWQFKGSGKDMPLQPGEDAVVCFSGAIDHSAQYPLSVNLNKPGYFVCYNTTAFPNPTYHPAPGNNITGDHILDLVIKTGTANAYTVSINSPALVLFRAPEGTVMKEYTAGKDATVQIPGSSERVVKIDPEWVEDAVEVFNGAESSNTKRLLPGLDAGFVTLSGTYLGHSLQRVRNEKLSADRGYEVLRDTNNSSDDFVECETQSLHDEN